MNILVSGAGGYLGHQLVESLQTNGHRVIRVNRKTLSAPTADVISADCIWYRKDIDLPIDAVIHCATCYGRNGETDTEIANVNVLYGLALLEFAVHNRVPAFLNIGTSLPPDVSTYAFTKNQFREWGKFYAARQKIDFIHLELEHFYGPDENPEQKFIAMVIHELLQNKAELCLTAGEQIRDFIHVIDAVRAILTVIRYLDECHGYRVIPVGSGNGYQLKEVVQLIHRLSGSRTELRFGALQYRPNELMYSYADISVLKKWGWNPEITLEDGLLQIIKEQE
ncbi:MAG: NAD-dependent epimerase/dehydratase family protein [Lentisphaeria bacterium]|nr:NAD-dependent epimerase/dehydratase family protein [Lentisphaeria bacterium]